MNIVNHKLKEYTNKSITFTPILNKLRFVDNTYEDLGKYIKTKLELFGKVTPELKFYLDQKDDTLAIFFIAGMEPNILQKMFGEPIYHDEFGEGFEGKYNKDTDEYDEPLRKESYASYMIEIDGYIFHIGYDHRGTRIEVQRDIELKVLLDCLKTISEFYIKNI